METSGCTSNGLIGGEDGLGGGGSFAHDWAVGQVTPGQPVLFSCRFGPLVGVMCSVPCPSACGPFCLGPPSRSCSPSALGPFLCAACYCCVFSLCLPLCLCHSCRVVVLAPGALHLLWVALLGLCCPRLWFAHLRLFFSLPLAFCCVAFGSLLFAFICCPPPPPSPQ